jgi:uncharacterized protein
MSDRIEVTGHGSVDEVPDVLAASLAAEGSSGSVADALAAADAGFREMTAAARGRGVADADLRSEGLTVHPNHDERGRPRGYVARMGLSLLLRDLGSAGETLAAVVAAGGDAARVQGAALGMADPSSALVSARERAFADATDQAQRLAALAGRELGRVLRVQDRPSRGMPAGYMEQARPMSASGRAVAFEPGSASVSATVTVRFELA